MDSLKRSHQKPTIVFKFNKTTEAATAQAGEDYSDCEEEESTDGSIQFGLIKKKKKKKEEEMVASSGGEGGGGSGKRSPLVGWVPPTLCQVDNCDADLEGAKLYYRRHKVCEVHAKAAVVVVAGLPQRFCQQCSRFHELSAFDESRRSCRSRLAGHNERRRKSASEAAQMEVKGVSRRQSLSITVKDEPMQLGATGRTPSEAVPDARNACSLLSCDSALFPTRPI